MQNDQQWLAFVAALENPSWTRDNRYATVQGRLEAYDELDGHIEAWTSGLSKEEVERRLKEAGIPAERVRRVNEVLEPPDAAQVFQPWDDPRGGGEITTGVPFTFGTSLLAPLRPAPVMGEHTREALKEWLGLADNEVKDLENQGALV